MFRESATYKLEDEEYIWEALAEQMKCPIEEVKVFVKDCVEKFKLFEQEEGFFYSPAFLERMATLDLIRQKRKLSAHKSWDRRPHDTDNDND